MPGRTPGLRAIWITDESIADSMSAAMVPSGAALVGAEAINASPSVKAAAVMPMCFTDMARFLAIVSMVSASGKSLEPEMNVLGK